MMGGGSDMFGGDARAMEASFKEFLARPENRALVEKHQRREVKQALQVQERDAALRLRDAVLDADLDAQAAVAPFLRSRVLRRVVQTFANDVAGDFGKWATNPRVVEMLTAAQRLIDEGRLGEAEAEEYMLRALRDPASEHAAEFAAKSRQVARLPTEQLVDALNEHLAERRAGNAAHRAGRHGEALRRYARARAVVELVRGLSRADQREVDANRLATLCNEAAAHLALKQYGAAGVAADAALALDARCAKARARRALAAAGRGEWAAAEADAAALRAAGEPGAGEVARAVARARAEARASERAAFGAMFARGAEARAAAALS
jgi:hypothetical protein